ncbi:phage/plasmid replication protein, II/X family [Stenotrophobium rhamnosiphilum]|uniref:DNA replication protein n=1 Tax=Stenotrophobium rhamnosiphilum TaxID=2029166 RepID=A0A2T5MKD2_9GAMM|nr:phage/plasmid replication protein, II/X family [Stenotrophobium rhamnosiphilum]PTU33036.1 DNA replication protein [Stenotrophobium rhamnosiphilum]
MLESSSKVVSFETARQWREQSKVFELETEPFVYIDWVTISQVHLEGGLPLVNDGHKTDTDRDGVLECIVTKRQELLGSYDDKMYLRSDGNRVEFHGNIARYERPDNVFGYGWNETIRRVNRLLNLHNLPPFTCGDVQRFADKSWSYTGARVSRIDITRNYSCGNEQDARQLILKLGSFHVGRQKGSVTPDGGTVLFGYGSKYASGKCYLKHVELQDNRKKKSGSHVGQDVIDFCRDAGVVREEFTLKSRYLTQKQRCWLAQIDTQWLEAVFLDRSQVRNLMDISYRDTTALSAAARGTLARYENGEPLNLKKTAFYRHRRELLVAGYADIGVSKNVVAISPSVKVVEVQRMVAPDWYRRKYG